MIDETNERLDRICRCYTNPETLNTLHSCRPGHPLNRNNSFCWRNAYWSVMQSPWWQTRELDHRDLTWLQAQAGAEWERAQTPTC